MPDDAGGGERRLIQLDITKLLRSFIFAHHRLSSDQTVAQASLRCRVETQALRDASRSWLRYVKSQERD